MLVDHRTGDDAGVFRLDEHHLLVQTVDFFTPVVDDPEAFGAIAAANALSDVYAMGGRPLTALSIAAFPEKDFPPEWAAAIVRGGFDKLQEAGCVLLGGHSVRDPEIKFGYAVTGLVEPERMLTNAGARPGDVLVLTKPLGTGVIATALKAGRRPGGGRRGGHALHGRLQPDPRRRGRPLRRARGHRHHRLRPGRPCAGGGPREPGDPRDLRRRPPAAAGGAGARALLPARRPQGQPAAYEEHVLYRRRPAPEREALLYDPQTSGGLLLLVPPKEEEALLAELPHARRSAGPRRRPIAPSWST